MLRVSATQTLALEIGGLDLLHAGLAVEPVDPPIDGQLDVRGRDGAGDGDLVSRAVLRDGLQRLMPADAVEQARGGSRRGKASGQHDGLYERSNGDSALFQGGLLI